MPAQHPPPVPELPYLLPPDTPPPPISMWVPDAYLDLLDRLLLDCVGINYEAHAQTPTLTLLTIRPTRHYDYYCLLGFRALYALSAPTPPHFSSAQ